MGKLQNIFFKITPVFIALLISSSPGLFAQDMNEDLRIADSLFQAKRFTQAYQIYESIYETGEKYSPAMLLRMAYIKEGLEEIPEALYFLNLYYMQTSRQQALEKMRELAGEYDLTGYEYSGLDIVLHYYQRFYPQTVILLFGLSLIFFISVIYQRIRKEKKAQTPAIMFVVFTALFYFTLNFGHFDNTGIITEPDSYIMSGPSAGSDVLDIVNEGHKVKILDQEDVWLKIKWENRIAYTKQKNIRPLAISQSINH